MQAYTESTRKPVTREVGLTGRLLVGGAVSTGLVLGGYTVAIMTLLGRMNGNSVLVTSLGLFIVGSVAGLVLGGALGLLGREDGVDLREGVRRIGMGTLYAVPACLVGAVLAGWIAMLIMGLYVGRVAPVALTAVAALVGLAVLAATFKVTCDGARNILHRVAARVR